MSVKIKAPPPFAKIYQAKCVFNESIKMTGTKNGLDGLVRMEIVTTTPPVLTASPAEAYNIYRDLGEILDFIQPGLVNGLPDDDPNIVDALKVIDEADKLRGDSAIMVYPLRLAPLLEGR